MRSPGGRDFGGEGVYREVIEPERIVFSDAFADEECNLVEPAHYEMSSDWPTGTLVTVTFAEHKGKTELTLQQSVLQSLAERSRAQQGWTEVMDRLAEELAKA